MSENKDFGFCPRCGALMQNGVCRSCGYTDRRAAGGSQTQDSSRTAEAYGQSQRQLYQSAPAMQPRQKKHRERGLMIALAVTGAGFLLILLILAAAFFFSSIGKTVNSESSWDNGYYDGGYYDDDYYDDYGYDSGYYVPDEDDPYYREIVDSTRTDLSYGISWIVDSITPDDEEDYCTYYSTYPLLDGDGDYSAVNREITQVALEYRDSYQEYSGGTSTLGYVTYMDEEMISIVFQHSLYGDQGTLPRVSALTFDLETGELLEPGEMITVDEELVMRFRSQNQTQNGAVAYLDNLSDEAFLSILNDPDQSFYFYSPVGLEAGFNYESEEYGSGWVSVTLKELAL